MAAMAAASASVSVSNNPSFPSSQKRSPLLSSSQSFIRNLRMPTTHLIKSPLKHFSLSSSSTSPLIPLCATTDTTTTTTAATAFHGVCYVLGDNIDTDQIIPAEYLTLVPSKPDEYRKLGSFALIGLPSEIYPTKFIDSGELTSKFSIIIAGDNFGCGSSREHAPVALGAAGVKAVVAESYARIFFRNSVATGEVYPLESEGRLCEECSTGDVITIELADNLLINHTTGKEYKLKPIGDAGPVIEAGGIFAYARKTGMIPTLASSSA
ncbi:Aconitase A/isopropylmalate dehydratase small subunit [Macleaya cordata]|uniref:3-isopropylmalate dehydratase n=1 Tax=Macleaya cordata TaxID=56857 RepID=A0A200RC57_MACCD|nr:Aconitase A/isopropylmalate dehydratase small subunit [Macleaya cordata]